MKRGDKVILKTNILVNPWDIWLIPRKVYTIGLIIKLSSEADAYILEEADRRWFSSDIFIPYKGLTVLIDRRSKYEV